MYTGPGIEDRVSSDCFIAKSANEGSPGEMFASSARCEAARITLKLDEKMIVSALSGKRCVSKGVGGAKGLGESPT